MIEYLYILLTEPTLDKYQCTVEQLKVAREVFVSCIDEKHFQYCYEVAIKEYCKTKLKD